MEQAKFSGPITLIKKSFEIFFKKENFIYFVKIYFPLALVALVQYMFAASIQKNLNGLGSNLNLLILVIGILTLIIAFLIYLWISVAAIESIKRVLNAENLSYKETMISAWKKAWGYFLVNLSAGLISVGGLLIVFAIWAILGIFFPMKTLEIVSLILIIGALVSFVFMIIFMVSAGIFRVCFC